MKQTPNPSERAQSRSPQFLSRPETHQTLDIQGTINGHRKVASWKFVAATALAILGILLWPAGDGNAEFSVTRLDEHGVMVCSFVFSLIFVASLALAPYAHIYIDFTERHVVTVVHYAWWETSKRSRPLTDFRNIVVRHLCHPGGEGDDTYTGSVGLKPAYGKSVLWLKSFPTTQDEVPRTTYAFARKLQEMTGLPIESTTQFLDETQAN